MVCKIAISVFGLGCGDVPLLAALGVERLVLLRLTFMGVLHYLPPEVRRRLRLNETRHRCLFQHLGIRLLLHSEVLLEVVHLSDVGRATAQAAVGPHDLWSTRTRHPRLSFLPVLYDFLLELLLV